MKQPIKETMTIKYKLNMINQSYIYSQELLFDTTIFQFLHSFGDPIKELKSIIFQNKLDLVKHRIKVN